MIGEDPEDAHDVEFFDSDDEPNVDSWLEVATADDTPTYMYNDNPQHPVGAHQIVRIGRSHYHDVAWELAPYKDDWGDTVKPVVDLESSMEGVLQYYKYDSAMDAQDWHNEGWPHGEEGPASFVVFTDPSTLNDPRPEVILSAGSARDWSRKARSMQGWSPNIAEEVSIYRVGESFLRVTDWDRESNAIQKPYYRGTYSTWTTGADGESVETGDRVDAIKHWRHWAIKYKERLRGEQVQSDARAAAGLLRREEAESKA